MPFLSLAFDVSFMLDNFIAKITSIRRLVRIGSINWKDIERRRMNGNFDWNVVGRITSTI